MVHQTAHDERAHAGVRVAPVCACSRMLTVVVDIRKRAKARCGIVVYASASVLKAMRIRRMRHLRDRWFPGAWDRNGRG